MENDHHSVSNSIRIAQVSSSTGGRTRGPTRQSDTWTGFRGIKREAYDESLGRYRRRNAKLNATACPLLTHDSKGSPRVSKSCHPKPEKKTRSFAERLAIRQAAKRGRLARNGYAGEDSLSSIENAHNPLADLLVTIKKNPYLSTTPYIPLQ